LRDRVEEVVQGCEEADQHTERDRAMQNLVATVEKDRDRGRGGDELDRRK